MVNPNHDKVCKKLGCSHDTETFGGLLLANLVLEGGHFMYVYYRTLIKF